MTETNLFVGYTDFNRHFKGIKSFTKIFLKNHHKRLVTSISLYSDNKVWKILLCCFHIFSRTMYCIVFSSKNNKGKHHTETPKYPIWKVKKFCCYATHCHMLWLCVAKHNADNVIIINTYKYCIVTS